MWAGVAMSMLALLFGWVALWPGRTCLGAWGYHVVAFPVGLLAWAFVVSTTTFLGRPFTWIGVVIGHLMYVGVITWLMRVLRAPTAPGSHSERSTPAPWTFAATGAVVAVAATVVTWLGVTAVSFDSYMHYEIAGLWLLDTGRISGIISSSRGVLVPAFHAANRFLGGDWTYVVYPMLSGSVLVMLAGVLYRRAFRRMAGLWRFGLTASIVILLGTLPQWVFHSVFVHSNMTSAAYVFLAVYGLARASRYGEGPDETGGTAWAVVAAVGVAGIAVSRPDGLAYVFMPLGLAGVLFLGRRLGTRALVGLFAGTVMITGFVFGAGFFSVGMWESGTKLDGIVALGLLVCIPLFGLVSWVVARLPGIGDWIAKGDRALVVAAFVNVALVTCLVLSHRESFALAFENMVGNLFESGGWGYLWYAAAGVLLLSLSFAGRIRGSSFLWYLFYAIGQFFAIAMVVHGITHPGRLSWMDSFNRVSLHVVPLVFWYAGLFVGSVRTSLSRAKEVLPGA